MKVRIHYTLPDGTDDALELSGTESEVRAAAFMALSELRATDPWSEVLEEER